MIKCNRPTQDRHRICKSLVVHSFCQAQILPKHGPCTGKLGAMRSGSDAFLKYAFMANTGSAECLPRRYIQAVLLAATSLVSSCSKLHSCWHHSLNLFLIAAPTDNTFNVPYFRSVEKHQKRPTIWCIREYCAAI